MGVITVPGPGPTESHTASASAAQQDNDDADADADADADGDEPPPPPPVRKPSLIDLDMAGNGGGSEDEADDALSPTGAPAGVHDPYSNLGVLGGYSTDEPRPMGTLNARGGRQHDEDLLF